MGDMSEVVQRLAKALEEQTSLQSKQLRSQNRQAALSALANLSIDTFDGSQPRLLYAWLDSAYSKLLLVQKITGQIEDDLAILWAVGFFPAGSNPSRWWLENKEAFEQSHWTWQTFCEKLIGHYKLQTAPELALRAMFNLCSEGHNNKNYEQFDQAFMSLLPQLSWKESVEVVIRKSDQKVLTSYEDLLRVSREDVEFRTEMLTRWHLSQLAVCTLYRQGAPEAIRKKMASFDTHDVNALRDAIMKKLINDASLAREVGFQWKTEVTAMDLGLTSASVNSVGVGTVAVEKGKGASSQQVQPTRSNNAQVNVGYTETRRCHKCGEVGHIARFCRNRSRGRSPGGYRGSGGYGGNNYGGRDRSPGGYRRSFSRNGGRSPGRDYGTRSPGRGRSPSVRRSPMRSPRRGSPRRDPTPGPSGRDKMDWEKTKSSNPVVCHKCGERGHIAKYCPRNSESKN